MVGDLHLNISDIKSLFAKSYDLDDAIIDRLEFGYMTKIGNKGN